MLLKEVINDIDIVKIQGPRDIDIKGVVCDSRKVREDFIFVAIKGNNLDGHKFIKEALDKGAACIIVVGNERGPTSFISCQINERGRASFIKVHDTRKAYAKLCSNFYKNPSKRLKVIGITGTNGKTTTTYLIEAILKKAGASCGRITTIDYNIGAKVLNASNTTPDAGLLQELLKDMADENINYCVMEVSSHALHQNRANSVRFHSAMFTNLSKEHLDYHGTMDEYFFCKKRLFEQLKEENYAVINIDDRYGKRLIPTVICNVISYGFSKEARVKAGGVKITIKGSNFLLFTPEGKIEIRTPLIGRHNIYNVLAAVSLALEEGVDLNTIKETISEFKPPPGRMQMINNSCDGFSVYVDYAHTDDALGNVLACLATLKKERIITVFGCGGDRDKAKRSRMGKISAKFSDFVIITNDNPRGENPADIIEQIKKGIPGDFKNYLTIEDRKQAIEKAIQMAKENDIILIAGKGHETYQIFKDRRIHFDDREVARRCLQLKK